MNKCLLLTALMASSAFFANAQVQDITAKYFINPGFELGTDGTPASSGKGSYQPYMWTMANVPTSFFNSGIYSANETANTSASAFGTTVTPAEGEYYFFMRKSWGSPESVPAMSQDISSLPEGKYLLTLNYKVASTDDKSKPYLAAEVTGNEDLSVSVESEKGAKQSGTYFNTASWSKLSVPFEVTETSEVTFSLKFYFGNNGANQQQDAILVDNVQLLTGDVDDIPAIDEALETIQGYVDKAKAVAAANEGLDFSKEIAQAEELVAAKYENKLSNLNTFIEEINSALSDVYKSKADVTALVVKNASFESGDGTGWTWSNASDTGVRPNSNGTYATEGVDGSYLFNTWGGTSEKYIKQSVAIESDGYYTLQALGAGDAGNSVTIYAGTAQAVIEFTGKGQFIEGQTPKLFCKKGSTLEIGATSTNWYKVDGFKLLYEPASLAEALAAYETALAEANGVDEDAYMNATVLAALKEAKTAEVNQDDFDALTEATAKLQSATAAAKASIAAYKKGNEAVTGRTAFLAHNNVASADKLIEADRKTEELIKGIMSGTLTDEEAEAVVNPYAVTGWRATGLEASEYLISAWDAEPYDWNNYHVNTWSVEGQKDGTDFVVPFIEYWTGDGNVLESKTMTAEMKGFDSEYKINVNVWVRLRLTNGQDEIDFSKIKFEVGEKSEPVEFDNSDIVWTPVEGSQFYLAHVSSNGDPDEQGNLKIQFTVEDGSNVSWMCWKDMQVSVTSLPTGLNKVEKADAAAADGAVYNLAGQKTNGLQKGLNIQNGKKILVK